MNFKKTFLTLCIGLLSLCANAQKETYTWFFGRNDGLDFKNSQTVTHPTYGPIYGIPTYMKGPINTYEGCFTMSDRNGNFLFASDGMNVYNGPLATNIMENGTGLFGHPSATQSGIVVPVPESPSKYYIFTSSCEEQRRPTSIEPYNGQNYSIVDMSLNNKKGKVIEKNKPLSLSGTGYVIEDMPENLTVVGHSNGIDYWLVNRMRDIFVVWAITKDGVSQPKSYKTGYDMGDHRDANPAKDNRASGMGVIKFAPDGKSVAHADYAGGTLSHAKFDPTTGVLTDMKVAQNTGVKRFYGIEYSPNGNYIYLTTIQTGVGNESQLGLYVLETSKILQPPYKKLDSNISNIQLGSMNRIFGISELRAAGQDKYLWAILNPDEGGTEIAKLENILPVSNQTRLGLPPFITTYFRLEGIYKGYDFPCINQEYEYECYLFQPNNQPPIDYIEWDWGDGSPKVQQKYIAGTTSYRSPHRYRKNGEMTIKATPFSATNVPLTGYILSTKVNVRYCNLIINSATTHSLN